jgi:hypothetical protein
VCWMKACISFRNHTRCRIWRTRCARCWMPIDALYKGQITVSNLQS